MQTVTRMGIGKCIRGLTEGVHGKAATADGRAGLRCYAPTQRTTNRMSNVLELPGCKAPTNEPNDVLIKALRKTLARAESGELQSLIGTGFTQDGARFALWCPHNPNVYETLGSIAWLEHEYVTRITEQPNGA